MRPISIRSLFLLLAALWAGCSDSTSSTQPYPLTLSIISHSHVGIQDSFKFLIKKDNVGFAGAKLRWTSAPYNVTQDLGVKSDTGGYFPTVVLVFRPDSVTQAAFQAVKDTLKSNYIYYTP